MPETSELHLAVALDGAGWHPAAWRSPDARPQELFSAGYWTDLAREAEAGALDFLTIEDSLGLQTAGRFSARAASVKKRARKTLARRRRMRAPEGGIPMGYHKGSSAKAMHRGWCSACATLRLRINLRRRRGKDSRWIRVWPETASASLLPLSSSFVRALRVGCSGWRPIKRMVASPCSSSFFRDPLDLKRTKALLKPGIHDADCALAHVCVSADTLSSSYEQRNTCRTH